jgi:hypothetical protein
VYLQCNFSVNIVNKLFNLSPSLYNEDNRRTHKFNHVNPGSETLIAFQENCRQILVQGTGPVETA